MPTFHAVSLVALIMATNIGSAMALSGTELYKICSERASTSSVNAGCVGYLRGFSDGFLLGTAFTPNIYCPPKGGLSVDQLRLIVEKHLREHPEELHKDALFLVGDAVMNAFRCNNQPK